MRFNFTVSNVTYEQPSLVGPGGRGALDVSQRHRRRVQVGDRLEIPDCYGQRQRSCVDVEDDADAAGEGFRTEGERDSWRRPVTDDSLVIMARGARVEDELGHARNVARYERGELCHPAIEFARRQRVEDVGLVEQVAAFIIDHEGLELRVREARHIIPVLGQELGEVGLVFISRRLQVLANLEQELVR